MNDQKPQAGGSKTVAGAVACQDAGDSAQRDVMNGRRAMFRYLVAFDEVPVPIVLSGDPVAFAALGENAGIEFWAEYRSEATPVTRTFTILGTGHPIPPGARHVGTAPRSPDGYVWHLYELPEPAPDETATRPGHHAAHAVGSQ